MKRQNTDPLVKTLLLSLIFIFSITPNLHAYDNDTHFWLTYYLAVKSGYTDIQATQIASADISTDLDKHTRPATFSTSFDWASKHRLKNMMAVHQLFHSFPSLDKINEEMGKSQKFLFKWNPKYETDPQVIKISDRLVAERKDEFWNQTIADGENPGFFMHYLQDSYAHYGFKDYIGHVGYDKIDFLASGEETSKEMTRETLKYLIYFRENVIEKNQEVQKLKASDIKLSDYLNEAELLEIDNVLKEFFKVNPSDKIRKGDYSSTANNLVAIWDNTPIETKKVKYLKPTSEMINELIKIGSKGVSPNSYFARQLVGKTLKIDDSKLPFIWLYDYDLGENYSISISTANKALKYDKVVALSDGPHNYRKEDEMLYSRKIKKSYGGKSKRRCLPFKLVSKETKELPLCE